MPLDSDVANADSQLHVEFYEHGKDPYKGQTFVRIMTPGDKTNIIDRPMREDDKARFPRQLLHFQMLHAGDDVIGVPLDVWNRERPEELSDGQMAELQILKFRSVEQVATASDSQLQRVGMGAPGLRERARTYLSRRNQSENTSELAKTRKELDEMKAQMAAMMAAMKTPEPAAPTKRPPGRPRKVNVNDDNASVGATGHE